MSERQQQERQPCSSQCSSCSSSCSCGLPSLGRLVASLPRVAFLPSFRSRSAAFRIASLAARLASVALLHGRQACPRRVRGQCCAGHCWLTEQRRRHRQCALELATSARQRQQHAGTAVVDHGSGLGGVRPLSPSRVVGGTHSVAADRPGGPRDAAPAKEPLPVLLPGRRQGRQERPAPRRRARTSHPLPNLAPHEYTRYFAALSLICRSCTAAGCEGAATCLRLAIASCHCRCRSAVGDWWPRWSCSFFFSCWWCQC